MNEVSVLDDRLDSAARVTLVTSRGPESTTYLTVQPSNPASLSPVFAVQMPGYATGCSRMVMWRMKGRIVLTGTNLENLGAPAFRPFPLQNSCSSIVVQINDSTISLPNPAKILAALLRKGMTSKTMAGNLSTTNCAPDLYNGFRDAQTQGGAIFSFPSAVYSNYTQGSRIVGLHQWTLTAGNTVMDIQFDIQEPLVVPPFDYTTGTEKSIFGVNTMQLSFQMTDIIRMLCFDHNGVSTTAVITDIQLHPEVQELALNYVTPPPRLMRDGPFHYGYANVQQWSSTLTTATLSHDSVVNGTSGTFDLPVVPKGFIIYVTYSDTYRKDLNSNVPDLFFPISALQVSFGTKAGLLASAGKLELYRNNQRNGVDYPYWAMGHETMPDGYRGSGNILYIDTAADLSLPEGMLPGMTTRVQFSVTSITATCNIKTGTSCDGAQLVVIAITDAILTNNAGTSSQQLGGVTGSAPTSDSLPLLSEVKGIEREGGYGGKAGRGWRNFMRGLSSVAQPFVSMARDAAVNALSGVGGALSLVEDSLPPMAKRSLRQYMG